MAMPNKHFVSADQVTPAFANQLIARAEAFKAGAEPHLTQPVYASNLFFEASTRTHTSFEMAERKLGMTVIPFDPTHSSVTKGETLEDTLRTIAAIGVNVAVIRHPEDAYYTPLIAADVPLHLMNAGDGAGQHPSQMMLDLMTIHEEFGHFAGLRVGIVGDLAHSRVARSDMAMLTKLGAQVTFSGPKAWYTPDFAEYGPYVPLKELAPQVDVLMLLRVQLERLSEAETREFSAANYHAQFGLTEELAATMPKQAIIMHPAPVNRDVELASSLVTGPQSRIFTQMKNGVFMRMAMLEWLFK
ncbi:aspartate carbamoyltransferase catalytic subunit [Lacticaseibacillus nasuensis]|uniref:aspartate carbamoyltransferase catalytic subunit n=1 Tax=Lacticaseibacillus nasuensis TaxID=944671 RepID=UPI003969C9F6